MQPYFGKKKMQGLHFDTDAFVLSNIAKNIIEYLKNLEDFFDFINLSEIHELFSYKNEK